ncbi:MAG: FitA-like ribbon-helix-helix domain-containing protein [Terriglobales bacterium]
MATITIRKIPDETVKVIKEVAARNGRSMEEELRSFLKGNYLTYPKLLAAIKETRSHQKRAATAEEIDTWRRIGRP